MKKRRGYGDRAAKFLCWLTAAILVYFAAYGSAFAAHSELGMLGLTENINKIHVYNEGEFPPSFYQLFHRLIGDNCRPINAVAIFGSDHGIVIGAEHRPTIGNGDINLFQSEWHFRRVSYPERHPVGGSGGLREKMLAMSFPFVEFDPLLELRFLQFHRLERRLSSIFGSDETLEHDARLLAVNTGLDTSGGNLRTGRQHNHSGEEQLNVFPLVFAVVFVFVIGGLLLTLLSALYMDYKRVILRPSLICSGLLSVACGYGGLWFWAWFW
jgi:hypothetical protein